MEVLEGFEGSEKVVDFSNFKVARIGMKMGWLRFGLLNLVGTGIIGMDLLGNWDLIIYLPNRVLRCSDSADSHMIPAWH